MRAFLISLLSAIIFVLPVKADNETAFWSHISPNIKARYFDALSEAQLPWALDYADSLDVISREKGKEQLNYYAQHIRSYNAYFEFDSLRFVTLIDDCIAIAKKYDFTSQYLCDYLNKATFYSNIRDYIKAREVAFVLVEEAQKTNDDTNLYYGYSALGAIYAETCEYERSNDYFKLALETFKESEYHSPARAQILSYLSDNYFSLKKYDKAIDYARQSLDCKDTEVVSNALLALSYYHLNDLESFRYWADKFMAIESFDTVLDYYRNCVEVARNILAKNYDTALSLIENSPIQTDYNNDLLIDLYKHKGDWKKAFGYQQLVFNTQDSLRSSIYTKELAQVDAQLSTLQKLREQDRKIVRQRFYILFAVLVILFLGLVTYLIMRQMRLEIDAKQKELEASNRFKTMIENAPFQFNRAKLIYGKDHEVVDYRTMEANSNLRKSFDKANVKYGSRTIMEAYPNSAGTIIGAINNAIKNKKDYARFQYHMTEWDQYYEIIIMLDNTDIIQIFSINTTELSLARRSLQEANQALVMAKEKAEKSDRAKTSFLQNMSHEIRTPLNAIMGFSQLLSLPDGFNTPEEKAEYAEYVNSSSSMLTMLIDDILDISDADKGNYKVELSDVSCNLICKVAIKNVEYRTPPGVKMYFTSEVDDDYLINTDPRRVQQVIINYLTNACKHTKEGEIHVHVSLTENPGKVTFSVTDTGTGVPADMAETIFERFTKVDAFVQGTGLGLNICSIVAEKLGGRVMLDTSYKKGARFLFIL